MDGTLGQPIKIGTPAPRVDGGLKVTGEAPRAPGVLDILTPRNIGDAVKKTKLFSDGGYVGSTIMPLGSDQIWHGGQIVAVVLAETFESAREAAHRLGIGYAGG